MEHFDIIIIGAGLSGIDAACHFKMKCPDKSFILLEGRDSIGGTWDLFKYPGIRSDSDMHTFSYYFKPWKYHKSIADAGTIMEYLNETVDEYELREKIYFQHIISEASWSDETHTWGISGRNEAKGEEVSFSSYFLMICTGYYDYEKGYTPEFKGIEQFKGEFIHPQKWPSDLVYENKEVVVIGSGATAITLIPAMADKTKHITMLQRSPSYILSRPMYDRFAKIVHQLLPDRIAHILSRWKNLLLSQYLYWISRKRPERIKKYIQAEIEKVVGPEVDIDPHFIPSYNPWDQRMCLVPDNDLFHALREGKCSIVTDHVNTFTEEGILLKSGKELQADIVVSATGLKLKGMGGISFVVNGEKMEQGQAVSYKGIMLDKYPNMAVILGYTNASWTLKADLVCMYVCRLLSYMDKKDWKKCVPIVHDADMEILPLIDFSSGYVLRSIDEIPKQGKEFPWRLHQNYIKDLRILKYNKIDDGHLSFS